MNMHCGTPGLRDSGHRPPLAVRESQRADRIRRRERFEARDAGRSRIWRWLRLGYALALGFSGLAAATTITVTSSSSGSNDGSGCTLRDAILAVNTRSAVGQCPAATGPVDTIDLPATIDDFTETDANSGSAALPALVTNRYLNIFGEGQAHTNLARASNLLCVLDQNHASKEFRLLEVQAGAVLYVADVDFSNGCADGAAYSGFDVGGAIANYGTLYLVRSRLQQNQAQSGGAVYSGPDALTQVSNADFESNIASQWGAAVQVDSDPANGYTEIDASLFAHNQTQDVSFAIYNAGVLGITNSTFFANPSGGIGSFGVVDLSFTTFKDNGSSIEIFYSSAASIKSSLLDDSSACLYADTAAVSWYGTSFTIDSNCTGGGANVIFADPALDSALASNGGPTQTLKLLPGSPATYAAVDCADVYGDPVTADQRGFPRPPAQCDAGAFDGERIFASGFD